jgi:hypothetical protein
MLLGRLLITAALTTALLLSMQACGSESSEEVATKVAQDWTSSNVSQVASLLGELVTGDTLILRNLAAAIINDQINENITWTYSNPAKVSEDRYRVVATASSQISINLLLLQRDYRLSGNFFLTVNTDKKQLQDWELDIGSFDITEL